MLNNDIYLIVEIFRRSFLLEGRETNDPVQYVELYAKQLEDAGKVFEFLQLARPDVKSPFGWRPTHLLIELIALRAIKSAPRQKFYECVWALSILRDVVFGEGLAFRPEHAAFCVLEEIGLFRANGDDETAVSTQLMTLIGDGYRKLRNRKMMVRIR